MITSSVQSIDDALRVTVENEGRPVASVDVSDDGQVLQLAFAVDHGRLPVQVRRLLVEAAFDLPVSKESRMVRATVPLGDVELLTGLRGHCTHVHTRAAGSTCLFDAKVAT